MSSWNDTTSMAAFSDTLASASSKLFELLSNTRFGRTTPMGAASPGGSNVFAPLRVKLNR
jgi:hypothetical protein